MQRERPLGYSWRTVSLPVPVEPGGARSTYALGIWELRLPRAPEGGPDGGVSLLRVGPA